MKTYLHGGVFSGSLLFIEGSSNSIFIVTVRCYIGLPVTHIIDLVNTVHIVIKRLYAYGPLDIFKTVTQWILFLKLSLGGNNEVQT